MKLKIEFNPLLEQVVFYRSGLEGSKTPIESAPQLDKYRNSRIQNWNYLQFLQDISSHFGETSFMITFHGRQKDYEDFEQGIQDAGKEISFIHVELDFERGKSQEDMVQKLRELFDFIRIGPLEELKQPAVFERFSRALNSEFEIAVMATMSSGKSTLINAMLERDLIPSKNEACTAKITRILDIDHMRGFTGRSYDQNQKLIEEYRTIDSVILEELNRRDDVHYIEIEGDIPYVDSQNMKLVLLDTPGPNNAQNIQHREHTYHVIHSEDNPIVLYVLNATQLSTEDDKRLLQEIARAMKQGGKQSRDRFIFVVNKMDALDPDKEDSSHLLDNVREYLKSFGIEHPNLFPTSAELAKVLRFYKKGIPLTTHQKLILSHHGAFIQYEKMHLEKFSALNSRQMAVVRQEIEWARQDGDDYREALVHSGLPSIELAINEYLDKYAVPIKVKDAMDSFQRILSEKNLEHTILEKIRENETLKNNVLDRIHAIREELELGHKAADFKKNIQKLDFDFNTQIAEIRALAEIEILNLRNKLQTKDISREKANHYLKNLRADLAAIEIRVKTASENLFDTEIRQGAKDLSERYRAYVQKLVHFDDADKALDFDFLDYIDAALPDEDEMIEECTTSKSMYIETRFVQNKDIKWYKPWTWFLNAEMEEDVYEDREVVDIDSLFDQFINPFMESFNRNLANLKENLKHQAERIREYFLKETERLDKVLDEKLKHMEQLADEQEKLKEVEDRLDLERKFIETLHERMRQVLEI